MPIMERDREAETHRWFGVFCLACCTIATNWKHIPLNIASQIGLINAKSLWLVL
jgi:hypothetical protein